MAELVDKIKTFTAETQLLANRFVIISLSLVTYPTALTLNKTIGVTCWGALAGEGVSVRLRNAGGTVQVETFGVISAGERVYLATTSNGCVGASGALPIGYALEASTSAGDVVEVLID